MKKIIFSLLFLVFSFLGYCSADLSGSIYNVVGYNTIAFHYYNTQFLMSPYANQCFHNCSGPDYVYSQWIKMYSSTGYNQNKDVLMTSKSPYLFFHYRNGIRSFGFGYNANLYVPGRFPNGLTSTFNDTVSCQQWGFGMLAGSRTIEILIPENLTTGLPRSDSGFGFLNFNMSTGAYLLDIKNQYNSIYGAYITTGSKFLNNVSCDLQKTPYQRTVMKGYPHVSAGVLNNYSKTGSLYHTTYLWDGNSNIYSGVVIHNLEKTKTLYIYKKGLDFYGLYTGAYINNYSTFDGTLYSGYKFVNSTVVNLLTGRNSRIYLDQNTIGLTTINFKKYVDFVNNVPTSISISDTSRYLTGRFGGSESNTGDDDSDWFGLFEILGDIKDGILGFPSTLLNYSSSLVTTGLVSDIPVFEQLSYLSSNFGLGFTGNVSKFHLPDISNGIYHGYLSDDIPPGYSCHSCVSIVGVGQTCQCGTSTKSSLISVSFGYSGVATYHFFSGTNIHLVTNGNEFVMPRFWIIEKAFPFLFALLYVVAEVLFIFVFYQLGGYLYIYLYGLISPYFLNSNDVDRIYTLPFYFAPVLAFITFFSIVSTTYFSGIFDFFIFFKGFMGYFLIAIMGLIYPISAYSFQLDVIVNWLSGLVYVYVGILLLYGFIKRFGKLF